MLCVRACENRPSLESFVDETYVSANRSERGNPLLHLGHWRISLVDKQPPSGEYDQTPELTQGQEEALLSLSTSVQYIG